MNVKVSNISNENQNIGKGKYRFRLNPMVDAVTTIPVDLAK